MLGLIFIFSLLLFSIFFFELITMENICESKNNKAEGTSPFLPGFFGFSILAVDKTFMPLFVHDC